MIYPFIDCSIILDRKQGCQPGFLQNQICRTGCGHIKERGPVGPWPCLPVPLWSRLPSALSQKDSMVANSSDATPPCCCSSPGGLGRVEGFLCRTVCTWPGRGRGLLCSVEPFRGRTVSSEGVCCSTETNGKPHI